jgi:succinoglycan biosynthesis transport protein ExoP
VIEDKIRLMENSSLQNDGRLPVPTRLELSETNAYRVTDAEAVIGVLDYWRILGRHKGALMLGAILGALAGLLIAIPETPLYQARASVEIEGLNENFLNMKDFSPTSSHSGYYPEFDIQTQVKILESRSLLERVVKKMKLDRGAALSRDTGRLASWRSRLRFSTGKPETRDSAIAAAAGSVRVKSTNTNRIVEIFCDSTDAQLAADFANTLVNEFIEQNLEMRWKATERTGEWLNRQLDELKIKLEKSEDQLQGYARSAQLLFTGDKENVSEEKLRQLQTELTKAHADRVAKQSKYELASSEPVESLPDVLDDGYLTNYRIKVTDLRRQLAARGERGHFHAAMEII